MLSSHYVYSLLDPRKPGIYNYSSDLGLIVFDHEPIYIGKGTGKRIDDHTRPSALKNPCNKIKGRKLNKLIEQGLSPIKQKVFVDLDEEDAIFLEKVAIRSIGCILCKNGPLVNVLEGGEKIRHRDAEYRQKLVISKTKYHYNVYDKQGFVLHRCLSAIEIQSLYPFSQSQQVRCISKEGGFSKKFQIFIFDTSKPKKYVENKISTCRYIK